MIRLLKLSNDELTSEDILSLHLGRYLTHGKVTYGTDIPVADPPKYVLFVLGNLDEICYLCHVADHHYQLDPIKCNDLDKDLGKDFARHVPAWYEDVPLKTWLLFDSMQRIPIDFLEQLLLDHSGISIHNFIKSRANNAII